VLDARVAVPLPAALPRQLDAVTSRAVALDAEVLDALAQRLSPRGVMALWVGAADPPLPRSLRREAEVPMPDSRNRRLLVLRRADEQSR
jgi:hypothetical protein